MASAAAMFGTLSYVARSAAAAGVEAMSFVAWRAGLAVAVLLVTGYIVGSLRDGHPRLPSLAGLSGERRRALLIACACGALLNVAMFAAFLRAPIAVVLICFYIFPSLVTIAAVPLYGERLGAVRGAALVVSFAGLAMVLLPVLANPGAGRGVDPLGIALALFAALCQATFVLIAGRGFDPLPTLHVSTALVAAGVVVAVPLALLAGESASLAAPLATPESWAPIVLGATIGAAIPTVLFVSGVGLIGPSRAAILMTIEPLVGVSIAALALGEQPSVVQLIGGALVLAAAAALQLAPRTPHVAAESEYGRVA